MKCEWVRQNIVLYVYDELPDDGRFELERHVERCAECANELNATREFRGAMSAAPAAVTPFGGSALGFAAT